MQPLASGVAAHERLGGFSVQPSASGVAAHGRCGVFSVQPSASGVSVEKEREREGEGGEKEQRDVALTEGTRAGGDAPEKEAHPARDSTKQLLRCGRKGLGLASTLDQTYHSLNAGWANGT